MSRLNFDIKYRPQIESGDYKVETRDGRPARIVCYNRKFGNQLIALATEADGRESYISCNSDGRVSSIHECTSDIIIITPEPELSEDEKNWIAVLEYIKDDALRSWLEKQKAQKLAGQTEYEKITAEIVDFISRNAERGDDIMKSAGWIAYLERQKEPLTPEEKMNHPLYLEGFDVGKKVGETLKEQKLAGWSEDIRNWKNIAYYVLKEWNGIGQYLDNPALDKIAEELQKRYGSVNPVSIPQWSEEDEKKISELKTFIAQCNGFNKANRQKVFELIDSLSPRPKKEWSEGVQKTLDEISDYLKYKGREEDADFIRHLRPQPHWKPSKEQMDILDKVYHYLWADRNATADMQDGLGDFIDDLKNL